MGELYSLKENSEIVLHLFDTLPIIGLAWVIVLLVVIIDMCSGLKTSRSLKLEILSSEIRRRSASKFGDYFKWLLFGLFTDILLHLFPFWKIPVITVIITLAILLIEGFSMWENQNKLNSKSAEVLPMVMRIVKCRNTDEASSVLTDIFKDYQKNVTETAEVSEEVEEIIKKKI